MIDPNNITNFNASYNELEEMILFWICAAGKNGQTAAICLDNLLSRYKKNPTEKPFRIIDRIFMSNIFFNDISLSKAMKEAGIGCYNNKSKTFLNLIYKNIDLKSCTLEELESIKGIGPKTSRCFLIHSRPNQPYAGLDRHILSYLRDLGYNTPLSTPSKNKYKEIENIFIDIASKQNKSIAELDLQIWNERSKKTNV